MAIVHEFREGNCGIIFRTIEIGKLNHPGDMPEGTRRAILRQVAIEPVDFLQS